MIVKPSKTKLVVRKYNPRPKETTRGIIVPQNFDELGIYKVVALGGHISTNHIKEGDYVIVNNDDASMGSVGDVYIIDEKDVLGFYEED